MRTLCVVLALSAMAACGHQTPPGNGDDTDAAAACTDGLRRCDGNTFEACANGGWVVVDQCGMFCTLDGCKSCDGPQCNTDSCDAAGTDNSNLGCEYWAVDLDNATEVFGPPIPVVGMECGVYPGAKLWMDTKVCYDGSYQMAGTCDPPDDHCPDGFTCVLPPGGFCGLNADHAPFAIVVSNPQAQVVAVTISVASGQSMSIPVNPNAIQAIFPQALGFADQSIDGTGQSKSAYKITSNAPIVAYQFNPLNNVDVFSNDASLLIPRAGFDKKYIAVTEPTLTRRTPATYGRDDYNGYFTVVAWQDNTIISVKVTADTVAGRDGTAALTAGTTQMFTLNAFDVLSFEAVRGPDAITNDGLNGGDLTGSVIQSVNGTTFGVFGGHEAVRISAPNSDCCADHLEEMLFPTSTWGKQFAVERTTPRRDAPDILRVVAGTDGTQVTFNPTPMMGACGVIPASGYCDVWIDQATEVIATQPITLAHLLMSAMENVDGTGDPSLGIVPPVEQFRTDYKFLAPMDYDNQYVSIVGITGDAVTLDGMPVTGWAPFGSGRSATVATISTGAHTVSCPLKCSVEVYGWSSAVSYLFAGGLDLHTIVIE